jgi:hypothetical protein
VFGLKRDEVMGEWRKLYNEELHNLYFLPSMITIIIKSRRMRWAGHVALIGEKRNVYMLLVGKPKRKEDQSIGGWIILGWRMEVDGVMWTGLVWLWIGTGGELL